MSPYAKMLPKAAAAIVPCANLSLLGEKAAPGDVWWVQDLSAATENILLQITEEGLGGVWLGWYPDESRVRAFSAKFGLPAHIIPFSIVALGYPAAPAKTAARFDPSLVHYGAYGKR
jgi:nitroreductase